MYTTDAKGKKVLIQSEDDPFALPNILPEASDRPRGIISGILSVLGKRKRDVTTEDKPKDVPLMGTDGTDESDQVLLLKPMDAPNLAGLGGTTVGGSTSLPLRRFRIMSAERKGGPTRSDDDEEQSSPKRVTQVFRRTNRRAG